MESWAARRYLRDLTVLAALGAGGFYLWQNRAVDPQEGTDCRAARRRILKSCRRNCEAGNGNVSAVRKLDGARVETDCLHKCADRQINLELPHCEPAGTRKRRR